MQTKLKKIIMLFLFALTFKTFANDHCLPKGIAEIMTDIEKQEDSNLNDTGFKSDIINEVNRQNAIYRNKNLQDTKDFFLNREDTKYSLAIEIVIKSFGKKEENKEFDPKVYNDVLEKFSNKEDNLSYDFYINYKKQEIIKEKKKQIPSALLYKSTFLDGLIYTCMLGENRQKVAIPPSRDIKEYSSMTQANEDFAKKEITKQKEVSLAVVHKYATFTENYRIHKKLESVIFYLKNLQKRFRDLVRMVGLMPAKFVNFGFEK